MLIFARGQCSVMLCVSSAEPDKGRIQSQEKWNGRRRLDIKIQTKGRESNKLKGPLKEIKEEEEETQNKANHHSFSIGPVPECMKTGQALTFVEHSTSTDRSPALFNLILLEILWGRPTYTHFIDEDPREQRFIDGSKITRQIWQQRKNWKFGSFSSNALFQHVIFCCLQFPRKSVLYFFFTLKGTTKA